MTIKKHYIFTGYVPDPIVDDVDHYGIELEIDAYLGQPEDGDPNLRKITADYSGGWVQRAKWTDSGKPLTKDELVCYKDDIDDKYEAYAEENRPPDPRESLI